MFAVIALFFGQIPLSSALGNSSYSVNTYISPEKRAPIMFTGLGASWHQNVPEETSAALHVRFKEHTSWSTWYLLEPDIDGHKPASHNDVVSFLPVNPTDTFQYKVVLESHNTSQKPSVENIEFTYINSPVNQKVTAREQGLIALSGTTADLASPPPSNLKIISRSEWGADESLRIYKEDNPPQQLVATESDFGIKYADELKIVKKVEYDAAGNLLTWPLEYPEKISKIIIHHTATTNNLDNPRQAIRDIYYWHTITRGWGDIGYNYIIDPAGNIYEGRAGGDSVVGAHAGRANVGSIGIAVLGNYQDNEVPEVVLNSLVSFINAQAKQYNIKLLESSMFRGENSPNLMGHRDVGTTSCPGEKLYALLPTIQKMAAGEIKPTIVDRGPNFQVNKDYGFDIADNLSLLQLEPGIQQDVKIRLANTGPTVWKKGTMMLLNQNQNAHQYFNLNQAASSQPLVADVQPGGSAEFMVKLYPGYRSGYTTAEFFLMIDGTKKLEKYLQMPVNIKSSLYDYEVLEVKVKKPFIRQNQLTEAVVTMKNTGNITWKKSGTNQIVLGSDQPRDHNNQLLRTPGTRLGYLEEEEVAPGQTGHFKILLKAPAQPGRYREYFTPLLEGLTWFAHKQNYVELYVYDKNFKAELNDAVLRYQLLPGEKKTLTFNLKNVGGAIWNMTGRNQLLVDVKGRKDLVVQNMNIPQTSIEPGATAPISFEVQAPEKEGRYSMTLTPKVGNFKLLNRTLRLVIQVTGSPSNPTATSSDNGTNAGTQNSSDNPLIRVDLSFDGDPVISANGQFVMQKDGQTIATFSKDQQANVTYANGLYTIQSNGQVYEATTPPKFFSPTGAIMRIENFERRPSWNQSVNYNEFKGALEAHFYDGRVHTINELPIEDYLKGTGEINEEQPQEKIRTIIIVARTYAYFYVKNGGKFPGAPFHLTDDPERSQKYVGFSAEKNSPNTVRAVNDTYGKVVTYKGNLIKTPYFSSDDGRTRSAQEVWGWTDTPYLISVADPYCEGKPMAGHGVGLSGCGSLGMAQAGKTFEEIIKYYYQGVDIAKVW